MLRTRPDADGVWAELELFPGECCLLTEEDGEGLPPWRGLSEHLADCGERIDLSKDWRLSLAPAADPPVFGAEERVETLRPVSDEHPSFSGLMRYEKTVTLPEKPEEAWFTAQQVFDVLRLTVNGEEAGVCLTPPWAMQIAQYLRPGENTITVEVASTPARDQLNIPQPPFDFFHEVLEPTGMFGSVALQYR